MASSQCDDEESNDTRRVSDLAASFEGIIANSTPKNYRTISRTNSFTASTLKETTKKKDEQGIDVPTTKGVQSRAPEVPPKPQRKKKKRQKKEKASNVTTTGQHQYDAEDKIISTLGEGQNEQRHPNIYQKLMNESSSDGVELEDNAQPQEKRIDNNNKPLHQGIISNLNETCLIRQEDVNVTQQAREQYVVSDNQQQTPSTDCCKFRQLGQADIDACMEGEIQNLQQENINVNKEREQLEKENDGLKKAIESQKQDKKIIFNKLSKACLDLSKTNDLKERYAMENERLKQEKNILKSKNEQLKQEINDHANEVQQLQQQSTIMESDINSKVQQLEQKTNKIRKLEKEHVNTINEIRRAQQENKKLKSKIQRLKQKNTDMESNITSKVRQLSEKANEIQQLQQGYTNMESDRNSKIQQLQEKDNEIQELQRQRIEMQNIIQGVQQQNTVMGSQIQELQKQKTRLEQQLEKHTNKLITDSGSVVISGEELGRGAYGAVFKGEFYGTEVAVKEYHQVILSPYYLTNLQREIRIASQCRHPNLLQFICATKNDQHRLLIVTELMDMTLRTLVEQHARESSTLENQEIISISLDVARGLNYLHSQKPNPIIHRDISSANVLLWVENNSVKRAKISDYGAANFMRACNTQNPGAILYAAPEATGTKHDPKIDVYSYGVLLCEMSICEQPNPEERQDQIERIPNTTVKQFVHVCTSTDPEKRPTMQEVIINVSTMDI